MFAVGVVEWVAAALSSLSERNPDNQISLSFGTIKGVSGAGGGAGAGGEDMSSHNSAHGREEYGNTRTRKNSNSGMEPGPSIPELLVQVLTNHRNNGLVVIQILKSIRSLAYDQIQIKIKFSEENIITTILKILKIHKTLESVCEYVGWMIKNFRVPSLTALNTVNTDLISFKSETNNTDLGGITVVSASTPSPGLERNNSFKMRSIYTEPEPRFLEVNQDYVYKDVGYWTLIVSCIENQIVKGELCCGVLCCVVLCCGVLCCIVLCCIVLCCVVV